MPKLTKKELQNREFLVWYYKWEFLRRNEDFLSDFRPIQEFIMNIKTPKGFNFEKAKNLPPDKISALICHTCGDIEKWENTAQLYLQLCKKWEMPAFIDSSKNLKDFFRFDEFNFNDAFGYFGFLLLGIIRGAQETYLGINPVLPAFFSIPAIQKHKIRGQLPFLKELRLF